MRYHSISITYHLTIRRYSGIILPFVLTNLFYCDNVSGAYSALQIMYSIATGSGIRPVPPVASTTDNRVTSPRILFLFDWRE